MNLKHRFVESKTISTAVILAGGIGKRMKSGLFPKSLIPVELINTLTYHLLQLKKYDFERIIIGVYKNNVLLKEFLQNISKVLLLHIEIIEEELCGSGGSVQNILRQTKLNELFLCISADSFFYFDYNELIKQFKKDTFCLFRKYDKGFYTKDKTKKESFLLACDKDERYCFSGIGLFDGKLFQQYNFEEKEFDLYEYLIEIAKIGKLNGFEADFPLFNLNCYEDALNINEFHLQRKEFIDKFCIKGIKCILFDLDFTLIDPFDIVINGINYTCEKLSIQKLSKEEIYNKTKYILPRDQVIELGNELLKEKSDKFVEYYYEYIMDKKPILYPGAISLLYFLKSQGFTLGIVTLKSKKLTDNLLDEFKIRDLFSSVITYEEVSKKKPDPEGLITAAHNLGFNKEDCLYIGDDINDAIAAQKCNMFFVGVTTGKTSKNEFIKMKEYKIYKNLTEVENKFRQLCLLYQYSIRYPSGVKNMVITSEKIHPNTKNLSYLVLQDPKEGINCLLNADILSLENILINEAKVQNLTKICHETIQKGNKIHLYGCGSSGRLLVLLERQMIKENNPIRHSITFNASGLDTIIPRSFADFEDNVNFGVKQLLHVNYSPDDLVITVSGSGTAPFLLEILRYAAENGNISPIHLFCNTEEELSNRCPEHKIFYDKQIRKKINFFTIPCGPMSITGSTRLQATLVMTITLGCALLKYNYKNFLDSLIKSLKNLDLSDIATLAKNEADIYKRNEKIIYKTDPDHAFITMMDTTERTATFNLDPFKNLNDANGTDSLCYLNIIDSKNSEDALFKIFLREPNVLEWKEYPRTSKKYFFGYEFSKYDEKIYKNNLNIYNDGKFLIFKTGNIEVKFDIPRENELEYQMIFKTIINIYFNIVMGMMKLYEGNVMTNVTACNTKLIGRICYLVDGITEIDNYNLVRDIVFQEVLNLRVNQSIIKNCVNKIKILNYIKKFEQENSITPKFQMIRYLYINEIKYKSVEKINEGYGNREYYRIENIDKNKNFLIAFYPNEKDINDFISISEILKKNNINIPKYEKKGKSIMILEDLGKEHFKSKDFPEIIDMIISLQNIEYNKERIPIYTQKLIYEEMIGFLNNFLLKFIGINVSEEEEKFILDFCTEISKKLFNSENKCFIHKDLNPSNILYNNNKFYLIDYQNALIGSCYYDLVSILFNERELLTENQIYDGIKLYLQKSKYKNNFELEFSFCIFHRVLKNLGCFSELYTKYNDDILISYIQNILDMAIFMSEVKKLNLLKKILEKAKIKFNEKYNICLNKEKIYNINININLIKILSNNKFFIITGTSSSRKTSMINECDFDVKISFDNLLREIIDEELKNYCPKEYEFIKKYLKKDIWYYARHYGIKDEPFMNKFLSSVPEEDKEHINKCISILKSNLLSSLEYRSKTWNKLINIIENQIEKNNIILLDIAYLKENDYERLKNITNKKDSYNPFIILNFIKLEDMTKVIKKRNLWALAKNESTEYRHIILNIYLYLEYYMSNDKSKTADFIINEEQIKNIVRKISDIDPYANTYHWEKFRTIDALKEFNFPLNMKFPEFINLMNIVNME